MVTRKQEAVKKPRAWFGWFWRWLGWQVRTAVFFPFCLILVVLEAETEWIELCTWCCQIALLSPTRPLPVTHRNAAGSLLFSPFYMPATSVEMLEYVYRLICFFYRCLGDSQVWCGRVLLLHSSHCAIYGRDFTVQKMLLLLGFCTV